MRPGITLTLMSLGLAGYSPARATSFTFTTIDVPLSTSTTPYGINDAGQISGTYEDASGKHGFIDSGGVFTTIDATNVFPPAIPFSSVAYGINNAGQVVGGYVSALNCPLECQNAGVIPFVYSNGSLTMLMDPFEPNLVEPIGINNAGEIVGSNAQAFQASEAAFLYQNGVYTLFGIFDTATGINDAGEVVGYGLRPVTSTWGGFIYQNGIITNINVPGEVTGFNYGSTLGINNAGEIVGTFHDTSGNEHGYIDDGGNFTTIDVPMGAPFTTTVNGVNNSGQIVGTYTDSSGTVHGFLGTPEVPEPASIFLLLCGLAGMGGRARFRRSRARVGSGGLYARPGSALGGCRSHV